MKVVLFLDIDGVLCLTGRTLDPRLVAALNILIKCGCPSDIRIVFNTAWNIHSLDEMRGFMVAAGFKYPECIQGQTAGMSGGGELARQWLRDNGMVGTPYVMVDDSTRMQSSWGRLAQCRTDEGLNLKVVGKALDIIRRGVEHEVVEKACAFNNLMEDNQRLISATPWLSDEERKGYIQRNFAEAKEIMDDPNFMRSACLVN